MWDQQRLEANQNQNSNPRLVLKFLPNVSQDENKRGGRLRKTALTEVQFACDQFLLSQLLCKTPFQDSSNNYSFKNCLAKAKLDKVVR